MPVREQELQDFLKSFRIALNFISLYHKSHKSFVASITELKSQLDGLLAHSPSLTIMFSPEALSIEGIVFAKKQVYLDLAKQFHFRKVKSLQLLPGVSIQELIDVMELASLPVKDLLAKGGMQYLLTKAHAVNTRVEELDYSLLLGTEGGLEADIGAYLLNQNMQNRDPEKIREFALHFDSVIANMSLKNIVEDPQLSVNIRNFLAYLRTSDEAAFRRCVQSLFRMILKDKAPATKEQMASFADCVASLSPEAIAEIIVDEASRNEEFNNDNLFLFLQSRGDGPEGVPSSLARSITSRAPSRRLSPKASQKLKDLFTLSDSKVVSGVYSKVMAALSAAAPAEASVRFDRDSSQRNYRSILLFCLGFEQDEERLDVIAQKISSEWHNFLKEPVWEHFKALDAALSAHRAKMSRIHPLSELDVSFRRYVEDAAFQNAPPPWLADLIDNLQESTRDAHWYLEKMFASGSVSKRGLLLFLRLFPQHLDRFCADLAQYAGDIDLIGSVIEVVKETNPPGMSRILEDIYGFSNDLIKIEALKAMAVMPEPDEMFLMPILSQDNMLLRKEAAAALGSSPGARRKAAEILLSDDDIWGRRNSFIEENIGIVQELHFGESVPYLEKLARKPFFWNSAVRRRAQAALEVLS
ncbi:MAG TPA: hypothetical protein PLJ26_01690, partial [Candidatus Omnitrophota bacterium]|nr:hypothetical protein [Candidatus Omnitrophota bacterium]